MKTQDVAGRSRRHWTWLAAVAVGLAAGVVLTVGFYRAGVAAYLAPGADAFVTRGNRPVPARANGAVRRGERIHARQRPVDVRLAGGALVTLAPSGELTVDLTSARLERGLASLDATAAVTRLRLETPAGTLELTSARVEVRAGFDVGHPGSPAAVVVVEEGSVKLETPTSSLTIEHSERGLLVLGRPPVRLPTTTLPPVEAALEPPEPTLVPFPVAVPVVIPVVVPVAIAGGTISGVVELEGAAPADRLPACAQGGTPAWAADHGHLANAFVRITSPMPVPPPSLVPVAIAQRGCAFSPRLTAVMTGQRVAFSGDGVAHGARVSAGAQSVLDARILPGAQPFVWTAQSPGIFSLTCDSHPDAAATLAVSPHPFFAVSGSDGSFAIANVPAGHYTLGAWHERGGEKTADVTVIAGRVSEVRFRFGEPILASAAPPPPPAPTPEVIVPPAPPNLHECTVAVGDSLIARACAAGGVKQAAAVMKQLVRAGRRRGVNFQCDSCHADTTTHELAAGAREQLQRLLDPTPRIDYYVVRPLPRAPAPRPQRR